MCGIAKVGGETKKRSSPQRNCGAFGFRITFIADSLAVLRFEVEASATKENVSLSFSNYTFLHLPKKIRTR